MDTRAVISDSLAVDSAALDRIRAQAANDPKAAIKGAAQQFEALFLGMVLKSMRGSLSQNTPFDSEQTRLFQSMLDQQFAQVLATRGTGLSDLLVRQLDAQKAQPQAKDAPTAASQAPNAESAARNLVGPMPPHAGRATRSKTE